MQLVKRNELGTEILQASAFAVLVWLIYHYFGPTTDVPPGPIVFAMMTVGVLLLVATVRAPARRAVATVPTPDVMSKEQAEDFNSKLRQADWLQLEKLVNDIYVKLGCSTWRHSNSEGESNFSLVIERAGQKTAVMCKPWRPSPLTSPEIIEFSTELKKAGMSHGVMVTLRDGTAPALKVAETIGIDVVDQTGLLELIAGSGENFRECSLYLLGEDRKFCPNCDSEMVLRTATKGIGAGEQFWQCTDSSRCRCTAPH